jgi:hypothetical protein
MRVAVYISGGATLFDLIRYAADIIRGVFGFNLDCDFHGSHVSMLHVPFGPWQRERTNSQRGV